MLSFVGIEECCMIVYSSLVRDFGVTCMISSACMTSINQQSVERVPKTGESLTGE